VCNCRPAKSLFTVNTSYFLWATLRLTKGIEPLADSKENILSQDNERMTRRIFVAQTATMAVGASTLGDEGLANLLVTTTALAAEDKRRHDLDVLLKLLPPTETNITGRINAYDRSWEDWVKRTGELPPDFEAMPSNPFLSDPVPSVQWKSQRLQIRAHFEQWVFGKMPPAPDNLRGIVTTTANEGGVVIRDVRLEFGPDHRGTLRLQLMIPPGRGPLPVFLTNHPRDWPWAASAVRRGYIGCIYFAADPVFGNADDSDRFIELYPEYDFSCLGRWAWAGMRAVDYLCTLPEVDAHRIAIAGHSRNGKQALLAAAFDERISAIIASSGNTGEGDPWRYTTDIFANESIEQITRVFPHWFHPRLRFFVGREHKLPMDQNSLMALVAPRGLFLYSAYAEQEGNPFGFEQSYRSALNVYRSLGHEDKIWMHLRDGEHSTTGEDDEIFCDFLDTVFGLRKFPRRETWIRDYTFDNWKDITSEYVDPTTYPIRAPGDFVTNWHEATKRDIRQKISWALGDEPAGVRFPARRELRGSPMTDEGWIPLLWAASKEEDLKLDRPFKDKALGWVGIGFGDDLKADLYFPAELDGQPKARRWPVVIWMHPFSYTTGYSRYSLPSFISLAKRRFAILAFDQIGFGSRVRSARYFYQRYPKWSLMGKMVLDTRAAIDAVSALDVIDSSRIYLLGYSLGAKVSLLTAALDDRVKAIAAVSGVDPLRLDTPDKGTEGIRQYSHLHGLLPRLGFFIGQESRLPFDYDEVLAAIAPRPVLLFAPTLDRYAQVADVLLEVEQARKIYNLLGRENALQLETPLGFNGFQPAMQARAFDWLANVPPS